MSCIFSRFCFVSLCPFHFSKPIISSCPLAHSLLKFVSLSHHHRVTTTPPPCHHHLCRQRASEPRCPAYRNYKPHYEKVARLFNGPDAPHPGIILMARVDCALK
ncbi:hypothetical protein Droror1_Dr00028195, partial [Drosera rotundifolia]